jgi:hypothetical protein
MVAPLIPVAIGLGGAALGGAGIASFFSDSKKSERVASSNSVFAETAPFSVSSQTYSPHSPYEQYSQAIQYAPVTTIQYPDYAINIQSPEAVATTKKEMTVDSRPSQSYRAEQGQTQTSGTDLTMIALIAGVALVAYGVVTR